MKYSEQMDLIAKAMIAVQKELEPVVKDGTNPHFKSNYATLDSITEYVRPILTKHNLLLIQGAEAQEANGDHFFVDVVTTIMHESGQYITSTIRMPLDKANPQGAGSAMTYGRRYGLTSMLAISTEDDDDAEGAVRRAAQPVRSVASQTGHTQPPDKGPACPKCGSDMWDNRLTKRSPKQPDYKCKDRSCDGVIWPPRQPKATVQNALPFNGDDNPPPPDDLDLPY